MQNPWWNKGFASYLKQKLDTSGPLQLILAPKWAFDVKNVNEITLILLVNRLSTL